MLDWPWLLPWLWKCCLPCQRFMYCAPYVSCARYVFNPIVLWPVLAMLCSWQHLQISVPFCTTPSYFIFSWLYGVFMPEFLWELTMFADAVFVYCFSPCYCCCCVVMIFALLLFSLMGLRAVSPLAAVYSSVSHRVFFKLCHVFCVFCVVDWCYCWCSYVWSCSCMSIGCKECAMFCCVHYWACVAGVSLGVGHRCWGMWFPLSGMTGR